MWRRRLFTTRRFLSTLTILLLALVTVTQTTFADDLLVRFGSHIKYWWKILPSDIRLYHLTTRNTHGLSSDDLRHQFGIDTTLDLRGQSNGSDILLDPVVLSTRSADDISAAPATLGSGKFVGLPWQTCLDRVGRWDPYERSPIVNSSASKVAVTAILIRAWDGCGWSDDVVRNIRAMVAEVSASELDYKVVILLHVRDDVLASEFAERVGDLLEFLKVPQEFRGMTQIWTYADMQKAYPGVGVYDVFYHSYMPVQQFMLANPRFQYVWNWELDIRYTSHYGHFFSQVERYASTTPLKKLFDSQHFIVAEDVEQRRIMPESPREVDLLTLLPTFNVSATNWVWRNYIINYERDSFRENFQACNILTTRLSRRLISLMDSENSRGSTLTAEMFAPTMTIEHGLTHVQVPHPIFMDKVWSAKTRDAVFVHNKKTQFGSMATIIDKEHYFEGSTWYFSNRFAQDLYRRWMGQTPNGPGSHAWEQVHGRICLPPMLLHPIKGT